ncbi:MAG: hypothetical protein AB7P07_13785 [Hyphomonadaceae bacterium]
MSGQRVLSPAEAAVSALLPQLAASPALHIQKIEPIQQIAQVLVLDEAAYRRESFLDDRILRPDSFAVWSPLRQLLSRAPRSGDAPHFIFHQGHTGSTLISRLLDAMGAFGVREPAPLTSLAELYDNLDAPHSLYGREEFEALAAALMHFWARRFDAYSTPVVKATSHAGRVGAALLQIAPQARAITLYLKPEPYLAVLLAGANTPVDLRAFAQERMRRVQALGVQSAPLYRLSLGETAALAWLAERSAHAGMRAAAGARVLDVDFDGFLAAPEPQLAAIASHFGLDGARAPDALAGPAMRSYSKAPEHAYSAAVRAEAMQAARVQHGEEIKRGLAWLETAAQSSAKAAGLFRS